MGVREMFGLQGQRALVFGAAGPVGRAIAVALAEAGADVSVASLSTDRDEDFAINSVANEIWALDRRGAPLVIDALDPKAIVEAVRAASDAMGGLTVLVNNTDRPLHRPALDTTYDDWTRTLALNAGAALVASQEAARLMIAANGGSNEAATAGHIINVTSILGERGIVNDVVYGASKAALVSMTRSLGIEWARSGIRVNGIGLGWIDGTAGIGSDEGLRPQLVKYVPSKALGRPEDIGGTVVFLASRASDFMVGEVIFVDGGALTHA